MALTIGSHPSSRRGWGAAVPVGAFVSAGPFTALLAIAGTSGMRSLLSVRFIVREAWPAEGAAVVGDTSRPLNSGTQFASRGRRNRECLRASSLLTNVTPPASGAAEDGPFA